MDSHAISRSGLIVQPAAAHMRASIGRVDGQWAAMASR